MAFDRDEVQAAFEHWWSVGNAGENWAAWTELFVPEVDYLDHFWGSLHGHAEVGAWIHAVMKGVPEIYGVYDWHTIENDTVVFHYQNRRDNPADAGPPFFDFAGLSVLRYAGDGRWASEEDFWDANGARRTSAAYREACTRAGTTEPLDRMTRRHWPEGPAWARWDGPPTPSWLGRDDVAPITRPSELAALLGRTPAD